MRDSIREKKANLEFNRERWGNPENWSGKDNYGYAWGGQNQQGMDEAASVADKFLRPYVKNRYDLKILELSPGGGRFTHELVRYAKAIDLLDMNEACLDVCKERFEKYLPIPIRYYANDGQSCAMIEDTDYDLIASFASMVHAHPDIIQGYVEQLGRCLAPEGILWIDHSGQGANTKGHRTDMTPEKMQSFAEKAGLKVLEQPFRSSRDCISIMTKK
ncbi:class I SAM-dependent methyltransferase [Hyphococcus sp.]|uniref:class I SAM-dependent methyltransferase n=1 Tax=Hyphococcus sp. TaxID=2038636 RepID=UPI003CCBA9D7